MIRYCKSYLLDHFPYHRFMKFSHAQLLLSLMTDRPFGCWLLYRSGEDSGNATSWRRRKIHVAMFGVRSSMLSSVRWDQHCSWQLTSQAAVFMPKPLYCHWWTVSEHQHHGRKSHSLIFAHAADFWYPCAPFLDLCWTECSGMVRYGVRWYSKILH